MSGRFRAFLTTLAVAALLFSVIAFFVRMRPLSNLPALVIAVASPYVPLVAFAGLVLSALCRRILLSITAVVVMVATLAVQARWYYVGHPPAVGEHAVVRVLSSNLRKGQADAAIFVRIARDNADVIAVSELTGEESIRLSEAGIDETFPYSVLLPAKGAGGIGLWSRYPISPASPPAKDVTIVAGRVQVPQVRYDPLVVSLHITSPVTAESGSFGRWQRGITTARKEFVQFVHAAGAGAVIVAGDFNSTPDMRQFRDLLTHGYRDAVHQTGAGYAPTFPSNTWYPPAITIDHVLTRNAAASSVKTVDIPGTDHRALLSSVKVPLDPTTRRKR